MGRRRLRETIAGTNESIRRCKMKSLRMAAMGSAVQTKSPRDRRRNPRPVRVMVCSRAGVTQKMEKGIWHNWLMEENYL